MAAKDTTTDVKPEELQKQVDNLTKQVAELTSEKSELTKQIEALSADKEELEKGLKVENELIEKLQQELKAEKNAHDETKKTFDAIKENIAEPSDVSNLSIIRLTKGGAVREVTTEAEAKKWEELGYKRSSTEIEE